MVIIHQKELIKIENEEKEILYILSRFVEKN
jgi:hypothetical protein